MRARELKFGENVHPPPHVPSQVSCVTCQVSPVRCQVSHVRCHMSDFFLQITEASRWWVCYRRGLPRLVFMEFMESTINFVCSSAYEVRRCHLCPEVRGSRRCLRCQKSLHTQGPANLSRETQSWQKLSQSWEKINYLKVGKNYLKVVSSFTHEGE